MDGLYYFELFKDKGIEYEFKEVYKAPYLGSYVIGMNFRPIEVNHYDLSVDHRHIIRDHTAVLVKTGRRRLEKSKEFEKETQRRKILKKAIQSKIDRFSEIPVSLIEEYNQMVNYK